MTTRLVGILNITPDSFSDGGLADTPAAALVRASRLIDDGADIIDLGAESTRPGATPISPEDEWRRLAPMLPEIIALGRERGVAISLDTRHAATAAKALACGISWINDVDGSQAMLSVLADHSVPFVVMHSMGIPADPKITLPATLDVIEHLKDFARERMTALCEKKIDLSRMMFDPGIGFGKSAVQSMAILARWQELRDLNVPILLGHSRKSFLKDMAGDNEACRDAATLACSMFLIEQGIDYLRVHDVGKHATLRRLSSKRNADTTGSGLDNRLA